MSDIFENNELVYGTDFGINLLNLRKKSGFTQQQLADMLGLNRTTYTKYETGVSEPSIQTLKKLAVLLDVDINSLLLGKDSGPKMSEDVSPMFRMNEDESEFLSVFRTLTREEKLQVQEFLHTFDKKNKS